MPNDSGGGRVAAASCFIPPSHFLVLFSFLTAASSFDLFSFKNNRKEELDKNKKMGVGVGKSLNGADGTSPSSSSSSCSCLGRRRRRRRLCRRHCFAPSTSL